MVSCEVQLSAPELAVEAWRSECEPFLAAMSRNGAGGGAAHGPRPRAEEGAGVAVGSGARDGAIRGRSGPVERLGQEQ